MAKYQRIKNKIVKFQRAIHPPNGPILAYTKGRKKQMMISDEALKATITDRMGEGELRWYARCSLTREGILTIGEDLGNDFLF